MNQATDPRSCFSCALGYTCALLFLFSRPDYCSDLLDLFCSPPTASCYPCASIVIWESKRALDRSPSADDTTTSLQLTLHLAHLSDASMDTSGFLKHDSIAHAPCPSSPRAHNSVCPSIGESDLLVFSLWSAVLHNFVRVGEYHLKALKTRSGTEDLSRTQECWAVRPRPV